MSEDCWEHTEYQWQDIPSDTLQLIVFSMYMYATLQQNTFLSFDLLFECQPLPHRGEMSPPTGVLLVLSMEATGPVVVRPSIIRVQP